MAFIRLKKRVTKTKENFYAYLVSNKWEKNLPKQKVSLYLGRYYKLEPIQTNAKLTGKENILIYLLKKELLLHSFKQKNKNLFIHQDGFIINFKKNKILNKHSGNPVCLGLNQGFLCSYTLKNLLNVNPKIKNKKETSKLVIRLLLEIGIKPDQKQFEEVFKKLNLI